MSNFRANIFGILAMLIASIALIISLLPYIPSVLGAPQQQEATSDQQVEAAVVNAIERTFNYQGTLYNQDGTVVESGTYTMTFRIYNAVLEGTVLHEEVKKNVNIRDGLFTVVLGDETPLSNDALATTRRYLGITIDPDPEMLPRQRIHPVPWALRATQADKATSATSATSANTLRPNAAIEASSRDGIKIKSAKSSGISVINASTGFYVDTATNNGVKVKNATNSGILVENSTWGFYAIKAGTAFQTENGKGWGMYVRNAGTGVAVEKTTGGYAGWFGGNVYVKGNCQNCRTAIIGRNATSAPLEPGAIVTINGISSSDLLEHPVVEVAPAFGATSILGVVEGRAAPQETTDGKNVVTYIVPQEGAAQPGEYVNIVTYGMAQVKVSQVGDLIRPGTRVTTSDEAGRARLLNAELPESSSNASVVGMALESSEAKDGLIWVLVNPR